jgi:uncharacterized membrane protein YtjA (UPF0391 family)
VQLTYWEPQQGGKEDDVLYWALMFFVIALIAGLLGFGGLSLAAAGAAQILFYLFLIFFVVTLVAHLARHA